MPKKLLLLVIVSLSISLFLIRGAACADEAQKAWLRMYATDSQYVYYNPDDWVAYSYVIKIGPVSSISLTIDVENHKGSTNIYEIVLTIVTNNTSVIASITVDGKTYDPPTWSTGSLMMTTDSGIELGYMPPHGVYNDPTASWVEHRSGQNLGPAGSPTDTISFSVTIQFKSPDPGDVKIHFDTYGWVEESGKQPVIVDDTLDAAVAPFSHDITLTVPEFPLTLAITSLGVCSYLLLKRKSTR